MLIFREILVKLDNYVIIRKEGDNMPATYTHHIFTKDVFKVLDCDIKEKLKDKQDLFDLFGKSFDILFFIKYKMGIYAHNNKSNLYFKNIVKYIKDNSLENNSEILAYLYGSICHYVLDTICHPYIFYKTGNYIAGDKSTYKYRGGHSYIESMIDAQFYYKRNNKPIYKGKLSQEVFTKLSFSKELNDILDYVYLNTFDVNNYSKVIYKGYKNYKFVFKYFMCSRTFIKKALYKFIDKTHLIKKDLAGKCYYIKTLDNTVLNLEHNKWYYSVDKKISYHYSFYDLYDVAIERARKLINTLDNALNSSEKDLNKVLREIGNLSYTTGVNVDKRKVMKYFQY